jgi:hypothetical protein
MKYKESPERRRWVNAKSREHKQRERAWKRALDPLIPSDSDPNRSFALKHPGAVIHDRDDAIDTLAYFLSCITSMSPVNPNGELDPESDADLIAEVWIETEAALQDVAPRVSFLNDVMDELRRRARSGR